MIKINGIEVDKSVLNPMFTDEELNQLINEKTYIELITDDEPIGNVVYIGGHQTVAVNGSEFAHQKFTPQEFEETMARLPYPNQESDYSGNNMDGSGMSQMRLFTDIMKALNPNCSDEMDEFLRKLKEGE